MNRIYHRVSSWSSLVRLWGSSAILLSTRTRDCKLRIKYNMNEQWNMYFQRGLWTGQHTVMVINYIIKIMFNKNKKNLIVKKQLWKEIHKQPLISYFKKENIKERIYEITLEFHRYFLVFCQGDSVPNLIVLVALVHQN